MTEVTIKFADCSVAEANRYARDLMSALRSIDPSVLVEQRRPDSRTMDIGTVLAIILGTKAVEAVAKGIAAWLERNQGAKISIKPDGVHGEGLSGRDAVEIVKLLRAAVKDQS